MIIYRQYSVCDIAYNFLDKNKNQPVFDLLIINPNLYEKVINLRKIREIRIKISHMWQYIQLCTKTNAYMTVCEANGL